MAIENISEHFVEFKTTWDMISLCRTWMSKANPHQTVVTTVQQMCHLWRCKSTHLCRRVTWRVGGSYDTLVCFGDIISHRMIYWECNIETKRARLWHPPSWKMLGTIGWYLHGIHQVCCAQQMTTPPTIPLSPCTHVYRHVCIYIYMYIYIDWFIYWLIEGLFSNTLSPSQWHVAPLAFWGFWCRGKKNCWGSYYLRPVREKHTKHRSMIICRIKCF